jgi:hypothetical protein
MRLAYIALVLPLFPAPSITQAQTSRTAPAMNAVESVTLHPFVHPHFMCVEHPFGQLSRVGDAVASDCLIANLGVGRAGRFPAFFRDSGTRNEDWYGWREPLLAPFDGVVDSVFVAPPSNQPGTLGRLRAGGIVFRRADGVRVLYAHAQEITVHVGDSVRAGQRVGRVGNNGPAYFPHTHIGAWRGSEPLQIRWDLARMGRMSRRSQASAGP